MLFEFNCGTNKNPSWEVLPVEGERIECVTTTLKHSHSSTADLIVLCGRKKEKQPHLIRLTSYPDGRQNLIGTAASQINLIPLSDLYRGCFTGISKKNCTVHIIIVNWRGGGDFGYYRFTPLYPHQSGISLLLNPKYTHTFSTDLQLPPPHI